MPDRPILFSGPMVRALLDGRKTQTRRVLGLTGRCNIFEPGVWSDSYVLDPGNADWRKRDTPYALGVRLWVIRGVWIAPGTDCGFGLKPHQPLWGPTAKSCFQALWSSINTAPGKRWEDNPWVVALTFTVERRNIDGASA